MSGPFFARLRYIIKLEIKIVLKIFSVEVLINTVLTQKEAVKKIMVRAMPR